MPARVHLPPGCSGLDFRDGTRYTASRPGGTVVVRDAHAAAVNAGPRRENGLLSARGAISVATKRGRWCSGCRRLWNAWSTTCPRCSADTSEA
ncbi:hypothetical protein [Streptomyces lavendulae]|uniref:hypothetical protein n=1 Tax=Streptomyces lavendulae TaxID=1914 RepID=UPI003806E85E